MHEAPANTAKKTSHVDCATAAEQTCNQGHMCMHDEGHESKQHCWQDGGVVTPGINPSSTLLTACPNHRNTTE